MAHSTDYGRYSPYTMLGLSLSTPACAFNFGPNPALRCSAYTVMSILSRAFILFNLTKVELGFPQSFRGGWFRKRWKQPNPRNDGSV